MQAKDALALLCCADSEFLEAAGPAVLRLKLLEVTHLAQCRHMPADMREAARIVANELRQLIKERPCVSLIDYAAKKEVTEARRTVEPSPHIHAGAGHG